MLCTAGTRPAARRADDVLKRHGQRTLRNMAGLRWPDSGEAAKRCGLKEMQRRVRQRRMQRFGHGKRETEGRVPRIKRILLYKTDYFDFYHYTQQ